MARQHLRAPATWRSDPPNTPSATGGHQIALGGGPVLKVNQNRAMRPTHRVRIFEQSLPSGGRPVAALQYRAGGSDRRSARSDEGIPVWSPSTSVPQLAVHSARELMAVDIVPITRQRCDHTAADRPTAEWAPSRRGGPSAQQRDGRALAHDDVCPGDVYSPCR